MCFIVCYFLLAVLALEFQYGIKDLDHDNWSKGKMSVLANPTHHIALYSLSLKIVYTTFCASFKK